MSDRCLHQIVIAVVADYIKFSSMYYLITSYMQFVPLILILGFWWDGRHINSYKGF